MPVDQPDKEAIKKGLEQALPGILIQGIAFTPSYVSITYHRPEADQDVIVLSRPSSIKRASEAIRHLEAHKR